MPGNGIVGGQGTVMCKTYTEEKDYKEFVQYQFGFATNDDYDHYDPIDPYRNNQVWHGSSLNAPFYYFDQQDGFVYRSDWQMNGSWSRKLKVRIMYKFQFNITGEETDSWNFDC